MDHFVPSPNSVSQPVRRGLRYLAGSSALAVLLGLAAFAGPQEKKEAPTGQPASPAAPANYAGSDTCQPCHEDIFKSFSKNPHHVVETKGKRGYQGKACESCHGPGAKHSESADVNDIVAFTRLSPAAADKICLDCHRNQPTNVGRIFGGHARNQIACTSCHGIHSDKTFEPRATLVQPVPFTETVRTRGSLQGRAPRRAAAINNQCSSCHNATYAEFQRPHKHPLTEAGVSCTDCHNPHGSFLAADQKTFAANEPGCFKCHANFRGPFAFEHAPVRFEKCTICHEPHGSANPRMLNRHEVMLNCLECHSNIGVQSQRGTVGGIPPAFHDLRSPRYRQCTVCHQKIHGSHVNKDFLR